MRGVPAWRDASSNLKASGLRLEPRAGESDSESEPEPRAGAAAAAAPRAVRPDSPADRVTAWRPGGRLPVHCRMIWILATYYIVGHLRYHPRLAY